MKKNKAVTDDKTWTLPSRVQFFDLGFTPGLPTLPQVTTALESYLDLLLLQARYGRKLLGKYPLAFETRKEIEKLATIESDKSLSKATRKRLIRDCEASLGAILRLAAKHGRAQQIAHVVSKQWPRQSNQINVFNSYRIVLRREGWPPTFGEWVEQDLIERPPKLSPVTERDPKERAERIRDCKRKRDHVIREMQERFKLPVSNAARIS
jgi:hypothetical protein